MNYEFLLNVTIVVVLVVALTLIAILAMETAIRTKSIGIGLLIFIMPFVSLAPFMAGAGLLYWYARNISVDTQITIGFIALLFGMGGLVLSAQQFNRMVKMGNIVSLGATGKGWQIAAGILVLHCLLTMAGAFIFNTSLEDAIRQNAIWWIFALCLSIASFFSFELREKGMVYHGRTILFSDIEHAEWKNLKDKTKLKIRLKNKEKEFTIKTPWKLITPIDNYVKSNFPRP